MTSHPPVPGARGSLLRPEPRPVQLEVPTATVAAGTLEGVRVSGVSLDSRIVAPGDLYVALGGQRVHGADFTAAAVEQGAVAVLTDAEGARRIAGQGLDGSLPVLVVDDPRAVMGAVAAHIYRDPAEQLDTFAITGTNGKTTTSYLLSAALTALGHSVGTIGTIGFRHDDVALVGPRTTVTTPESVDLHGLLGLLVERGADSVAMEVSSHALQLGRTDGMRFDVAGFTNLGQDHLDFHRTMEDYFEAKARLFTSEHTRRAAVVVDDEWGVRLARRIREVGEVELATVSWPDTAESDTAESDTGQEIGGLPITHRVTSVVDQHVTLQTPTGELTFDLGLPGDFNVRNAALACAMLQSAGLDAAAGAAAFAELQVPGRMQGVRLDAPDTAPRVFVDFAHTPQAVRAALTAFTRARREGRRVISVIGCGGDRDATKRGPMGAVAAQGSDIVVVTDDNPRTEDPETIRAAVIAGAREAGTAEVIDGGDRRSAIATALSLAGADDIVTVLGKGHEQGQDLGGLVTPFDDAQVVAELWQLSHRARPERAGQEDDR